MSVLKALEYLENAESNCDNVRKLGVPIVDIVKQQIQSAMKELEKEGDD